MIKTKSAVIVKYSGDTEQTEGFITNPASQCYKESAMSGVTNPTFQGARQECAELPMMSGENPAAVGSAIVRSIIAPPKVTQRSRVLVIDDDPDIAPLVSTALVPFRVCVDSVTSGTDAITRLQSQWYDLLVLDLMLADLHGFEVLRHMKADRKLRKAKVLVLTADNRLEALARSFGHGADDFVKKPFAVKELGMRAFRLLDNSGGW
jgi:CheY-like chemotaxis protein